MILSQAENTEAKRKAWKKQRVACAAQRRFRCKPDCVHVRYNHHQTVMISAINIIIIISPFFIVKPCTGLNLIVPVQKLIS